MSGIIVSRIEAANSHWHPWNDGTGKRKWFLARIVGGLTEYHWSKPDPHGQQHVIRYARYETALRAAERLDVSPTLGHNLLAVLNERLLNVKDTT